MYISKLIRWREDKKKHANFVAQEERQFPWVVAGLKKAGTAAMHRTLMLYVNEIGFYALNEKYSAENLLVNILATAKRGSKVLGSLRRMETEQNEPNRCSLSTRADYMLFEPFQNVQQLRFVGVARKGNNLILLHNPTKKAWRKSLRHAPIKENLIVKIEISYSSLVLCILRVEVGPTAHPVVAAIEGADVGYGVETGPAGETCGTEQSASGDRSIAISTY